MRTRTPVKRGEMEAITVILCLGGFPNVWEKCLCELALRRAPTWRLHTKPYNFQWNLLLNNSSSEYRTSQKLWHVVYLLLFYDISISWLNILNGKLFYFSLVWWLSLLVWRKNTNSFWMTVPISALVICVTFLVLRLCTIIPFFSSH